MSHAAAPRPLSICVYCGARPGNAPAYRAAAQLVGSEIGRRGWQLIYGGGHSGLMGEVADAVLAHGGRVIGVIPNRLVEREMAHTGLHELHKVESMHQRKQMMADLADAFIALPGGIGTLEELFEAWTWQQLGYHNKPVGLLNAAGYFDALLSFMAHTVSQGFLSADQNDAVQVETDALKLLDGIAVKARAVSQRADYSGI